MSNGDFFEKDSGNASDGKRNYRHCEASCCGNCRWFGRFYEETFCEHPKNVVDVIEEEYVAQPTDDMVCDWWEKKERRMMPPLLKDALQIIEIAAIHDYKPGCLTKEQGELFISKVRECMGELGTSLIERIAFRLLAWLDDNERLPYWDKRKLDATEWKKLCDELFVEFNNRLEKQEKDNA